ncbi:MAG: nucleotide exchange factor GrpE [Terrisporobacter othiniensis]|nr:nucleotide exchange factor GrpE [Terrisporobacter othiniensis]MDU6995293.1 nucleotide exchange factor GrpE [Terrisporobacter othiniensis]
MAEVIMNMKSDLRIINKNSKKSIMSIESLKEDLNKNNKENFKLKKEIEERKINEIKIYRKIILILDQIDSFEKIIADLDNEEFLYSLDIMKKIISKEMSEINLVEIKSMGEFFNPELYKCVAVEEDILKESKEIIGVIKKGYMLRGKVIRPASVIIAR